MSEPPGPDLSSVLPQAPILRLPDEILHEIFMLFAQLRLADLVCDFSALENREEVKTRNSNVIADTQVLARLCLTSRRISNIATPLLYRYIRAMKDNTNWFKFVSTLRAHPELHAQVRVATINLPISVHGIGAPPPLHELNEKGMSILDYKKLRPEEQVETMLCYLPNLRRLFLQCSSKTDYSRFMFRSPPKLDRLVHLQLKCLKDEIVDLKLIAPLLAHADNLRALWFDGVFRLPPDMNLRTLERIVWWAAGMEKSTLINLFKSCRQLRSAQFVLLGSPPAGITSRVSDRKIIQALLPCRMTLSCIRIAHLYNPKVPREQSQIITSLKSFVRLRYVSLDDCSLFSLDISPQDKESGQFLVNLLPPSIVTLHIRMFVSGTIDYMQTLPDLIKKGAYRYLRHIVLTEVVDGAFVDEELFKLLAKFESVGRNFVVKPLRPRT